MATETAHDGLRPAIGARLLYLMVVGDILGAGIYILVGDVAGELGGMAWLAFATAFGIAALSAASYSELTTRFPGAAGSALYIDRAAGIPALTFAVGMAVMLSSLMTAATTARAFAGDYLAEFVDAPVVLVAIGVVAALTALNLRGIESTANANVAMTIIEIVGLLVVLVIGIAAISSAIPAGRFGAPSEPRPWASRIAASWAPLYRFPSLIVRPPLSHRTRRRSCGPAQALSGGCGPDPRSG